MVFAVGLAAFFVITCASTGNRGLTLYGEARVIDADHSTVFNAAKDYIMDLGFPVLRSDEEKGQNMRSSGTKEFRAKFRARTEKVSETQTRLTLEYFPEEKDLHTSWELIEIDMQMSRSTYNRYFEQIKARIEGRTIK